MSDNSKIEWTDATWNPIRARHRATGKVGWHCEHASEGCRNCYAEGMNKRLGTGLAYKPGHRDDIEIFLDDKTLLVPLKWKKPRRIFVGSMTDLFADFVTDEMLDRVFAVMALAPQHTFQVLTKRSARLREYMTTPWRKRIIAAQVLDVSDLLARSSGHKARPTLDHFSSCFAGSGPFANVWLGVSCEDQASADARIPDLLATPAAVRFLSCEPLLGAIYLTKHLHAHDCDITEHGAAGTCTCVARQIDWVIAGGESGPHARPMHPDWARALRDQCAAAGVAFFFKQWGEWASDVVAGTEVDVQRLPRNHLVGWGDGETYHTRYRRLGKARAGRLLDGVTHDAFPLSAHSRASGNPEQAGSPPSRGRAEDIEVAP